MIIKNGRVFTGDNGIINADILIEDGKIKEIRKDIESDEEIIDATGLFVMPGMIDAHCHLGIIEQNIGSVGSDVNEIVNPVTPNMRAIDGINPFDGCFRDAVRAGITTVVTGPGSANVIGGTFTAIKTCGICIDEMIVKDPIGMKIAFGENPKRVYGGKSQSPSTRMATAAILRETLMKANDYLNKKKRAMDNNELFERDSKFEALIPVLKGEIPLKAHAHRADDILTALRIAKEFNLDITLDHCTEGHLIKDYIKKSGKSAIVGPTMSFNSKIELTNKSYKTPKVLHDLGVKVAIMTDHPVIPIQQLPLCAGLCMREGISFEETLKMITVNAAKIANIDDRVGDIKEGLDADIVILSGSPFEIATKTLYTIVSGEIVYRDDL